MDEGIYIAYVTGEIGYSAILFVLRNNRITGADVGGLKYSGRYKTTKNSLTGILNTEFPAGVQSVTGYESSFGSRKVDIPFEIKFSAIGTGYIQIESPLGIVSANIQKVQELP
jgi:hypothetical protein